MAGKTHSVAFFPLMCVTSSAVVEFNTYLLKKQWAADTTQQEEMRVPPQKSDCPM